MNFQEDSRVYRRSKLAAKQAYKYTMKKVSGGYAYMITGPYNLIVRGFYAGTKHLAEASVKKTVKRLQTHTMYGKGQMTVIPK